MLDDSIYSDESINDFREHYKSIVDKINNNLDQIDKNNEIQSRGHNERLTKILNIRMTV